MPKDSYAYGGKMQRIETIVKMRQQGMTLQKIGDELNLSRERIRQILQEAYNTTKLSKRFTSHQVATILGIPVPKAWRYAIKYGITRYGHQWCWSKKDITRFREFLGDRRCKICGEKIPSTRTTFCSDACHKRSSSWVLMSEDRKKAHKRAVQRWTKKNPEKAKAIWLRAHKKWLLKKKKGIPEG